MRRASVPIVVVAGIGVLISTAAGAASVPRPRPPVRPVAPSTAPAARPTPPPPTPVPTASRTLAITHEEMGCVIVGKFPQFSACFDPAADLAKADMFFRSEKNTSWYRVAFKPEGSCHKAVLPKPSKALLNTSVLLYASGASRQWGEARTREYSVKVVASEGECKGEKPVAPWLPSANVAVFPSMPLGFAAGGGLPAAAIAGGAVVVGGGGAVAATQLGGSDGGSDGGGGPDGGTTSTSTPTPTPAPATATPTPTPSTPTGDLPPILVCRTTPDPPQGVAPLSVELNLCRSEDPEGRPLSYRFEFGDGGSASGFCREIHVYNAPGDYTARMCVTDGTHAENCCTKTVRAQAAPVGCGSPSISVVAPKEKEAIDAGRGTYTVILSPSAPAGIAKVDFKAQGPRGSQTFTKTSPPWEWAWDPNMTGTGPNVVGGTVHDTCSSGSQQASASVNVTVFVSFAPEAEAQGNDAALLVGELDVEEGSGRVVHNQSRLAFVRAGRGGWMQKTSGGINRIEAVLAQGRGAGTWRFTLPGRAFRPGSLRVLEGEPSLVTADGVVFRLAGRAGERVVFTFEPAK